MSLPIKVAKTFAKLLSDHSWNKGPMQEKSTSSNSGSPQPYMVNPGEYHSLCTLISHKNFKVNMEQLLGS